MLQAQDRTLKRNHMLFRLCEVDRQSLATKTCSQIAVRLVLHMAKLVAK